MRNVIQAWGVTIHKAQGMTLEYLTIDLSDVFECGMTYVAMSRGVTCDHMCVKGFKKEDVKTNPRVLAFDKTIRGERKAPHPVQSAPVIRLYPFQNPKQVQKDYLNLFLLSFEMNAILC